MSDLGSEELEEEGENDLGVRVSGKGGAPRVAGTLGNLVQRVGRPGGPAQSLRGGAAKDKDHAGHSGLCVLRVGSER